jgi:hypothetical protein
VPTQALYFLNDPFFHEQAARLAGRLPAGTPEERVTALYRLVLQRPPSSQDRDFCAAFLTRYEAALPAAPPAEKATAAWEALTRVLLAGNEFLYLD